MCAKGLGRSPLEAGPGAVRAKRAEGCDVGLEGVVPCDRSRARERNTDVAFAAVVLAVAPVVAAAVEAVVGAVVGAVSAGLTGAGVEIWSPLVSRRSPLAAAAWRGRSRP
jgi:hypothetical protein